MFTNKEILQGLPALENVVSPLEGMAQHVHQSRCTLKVQYNFAVQGGAIGTLSLLDDQGNAAIIPNKAIIAQVYIDWLTPCTSGGSATISLQANSAGDLLNALAVASATGITAGIPVGTAGTMVKATADRTLKLVIATAALTAGVANIFVDFVYSN